MSTERRLYADALPEAGGEVELGAAAARHALVLRLSPGDAVTLFDGNGRRAEGHILACDAGSVRVAASAPSRAVHASGITLVQCLPRGGKLDDLVRSATELGVDSIRLATSAHSVGKADDERWERRHERLLRVVREAARQSERDSLPTLEAPAPLMVHATAAPEAATRLVLCGRTGAPLGPLAADAPAWLVVGPEGGLASSELSGLDGVGFRRASLGPSILRVETAVVAAISAVKQARSHR